MNSLSVEEQTYGQMISQYTKAIQKRFCEQTGNRLKHCCELVYCVWEANLYCSSHNYTAWPKAFAKTVSSSKRHIFASIGVLAITYTSQVYRNGAFQILLFERVAVRSCIKGHAGFYPIVLRLEQPWRCEKWRAQDLSSYWAPYKPYTGIHRAIDSFLHCMNACMV